MKKRGFYTLILLYGIGVLYLATTTPITPHEAKYFFLDRDITSELMRFGWSIYPNFFGLRLVFILFGLLSIYLYYSFSKIYFKDNLYLSQISTLIFMLLPGILTASVLSNIAIVVIDFVLFFLIFYYTNQRYKAIFSLLILFFIHQSSIIFFIALFIFALNKKDKLLLISVSSFILSFIYLAQGIEISGRPSGHFMDIFALYASLFSPFVFIYFIYIIYRIFLREDKDMIWYISSITFIVSMILSIRQKIHITDFAPYVTISVVLMVLIYDKTLQIRLPKFQYKYKLIYKFTLATLIISILVILFNKFIFEQLENKKRHFAYKIYYPYTEVLKMKKDGKNCIKNIQHKYIEQYRFYGVESCKESKKQQCF
jgi:hypothetical protein